MYARTIEKLTEMLRDVKSKMCQAGLEWNVKKCKYVNMIKGKKKESQEKIDISEDFKLETLKENEMYKFLGVPESTSHDTKGLVEELMKLIKQRGNIIWSSPLSDFNKVLASNLFINSVCEYYFWSEQFNITDIREMDVTFRKVLNRNHVKHPQMINDVLYLSRKNGGRGLRNFENSYKIVRISSIVKVMSSKDPRMKMVAKFCQICREKGRKSILTEAIRFSKDFGLTIEIKDDGVKLTSSDGNEIEGQRTKHFMKAKSEARYLTTITNSTWQGLTYQCRINDEYLIKSACYNWLTKWKYADVQIINDIQSIYCQVVKTRTYELIRYGDNNLSTICRMCKKNVESVRHILSSCEKFLPTDYKNRHDDAFKCIFFQLLHNYGFIDNIPPWYSKVKVKPIYENENVSIFWDIPEYTGDMEENDLNIKRPDGKLILHSERVVFVLENTVPWITNRETKLIEKETKYEGVLRNLKITYPDYKVKQITFIMDALGGYSAHLRSSLKDLFVEKKQVDKIIFNVQKVCLHFAVRIINKFKLTVSLN